MPSDETLTDADARTWAADHGHPQPERVYRVVLHGDGLVEVGELLLGELAADYLDEGSNRG